MRAAVASATAVNTHLIAYAEACATFTRLARERKNPDFYFEARARLDQAWKVWRIVQVDESLVRRAGDLAQRFGLRGYDSVHLAAAEAVWRALPGVDYRVGVLDGKLAEAARGVGMWCWSKPAQEDALKHKAHPLPLATFWVGGWGWLETSHECGVRRWRELCYAADGGAV